jgi:hypothetical protein
MSLIDIKVPGASRSTLGAGDILLLRTPHHQQCADTAPQPVFTGYTRTGNQHNVRAPRIQVPPTVLGHRGQIIAPHNLADILQETLELMGPAPL